MLAVQAHQDIAQRSKATHPFYGSSAWKALLREIIAARGRRCENRDCETPNRGTGLRIYGDHIRELRDGGAPLDPANIKLLCASCHRIKTLRVAKQRNAQPFTAWSGWRG